MNSVLKEILEWGYCIIIAVALALLIRYYIGTPTIVKQPSMYDTLQEGNRLLLNRWIRTVHGTYKRGDIITFEAPSKSILSAYEVNQDEPIAKYEKEPQGFFSRFYYYVLEFNKTSYIKRVIGIAGDHIKIEDGKVYLNEEELQEDYVREGAITDNRNFSDIIVPEGYVFVMGDNREHSADSRNFGCIPVDKIEGKVWIRFWPLSEFGKIKK